MSPPLALTAKLLADTCIQSMPGKGNLQLTGKLGEVIRESAQIALSWVKTNAWLLGVTKSEAEVILNDRDLHLHMCVCSFLVTTLPRWRGD